MTTPTAAVVAMTDTTLTVKCVWCKRRHRHDWPDGQTVPAVVVSHCKRRRRPYVIDQLPPRPLLQLASDLQQTAVWLRRTPWLDRFPPADRAAVAMAAKALVDAVDAARARHARKADR